MDGVARIQRMRMRDAGLDWGFEGRTWDTKRRPPATREVDVQL